MNTSHNSDATAAGPEPSGTGQPVARILHRLSWFAAMAGALMLVGLAVMLVITIVSRKLFAWQVAGDHELVQMFGAFAISLMFPWCHLLGGNVVVDMFTAPLPDRLKSGLDRIGSLLLTLVALLLAWRTGILATESRASSAISPILGWPVWIWQAAMIPGLVLTALNALYIAILPNGPGASAAFAEEAGVEQ